MYPTPKYLENPKGNLGDTDRIGGKVSVEYLQKNKKDDRLIERLFNL